MKNQVKLVVLAVSGLFLLAAGGFAWACTLASSVAVERAQGPAGVPVNITGATFAPGPVEVRWNSADGPLLATAQGPQFSVPITPPASAASDVYYIVAIQKSDEGVFKASETFEVTGAAATSAPATSTDLWSGFDKAASSPVNVSQPSVDSGTGPAAMTGFALLAAGLSGLFIAATIPAIRSRRTKASVRQH